MNRLIGIVVGIAAVVGMKFYNRGASESNVKAQFVQICAGDAKCVQAVETHFPACFESSYKMKRRGSSLNEDALVECINSRAGTPYFVVEKEKE
jgi:hypothetical protein